MVSLSSPQNSVHQSPSYSREDWSKGYESQPNEYDYIIEEIEGKIPPNLTGTLYRNGPGLLDINGQKIHHPFDGDGMICAITFKDSQAYFRNRFVQTEGYQAEKKAGKILYRGTFGTQKPGGIFANFGDLKIKNVANTNLLYWGKKLVALWEGSSPYSLHPHTLETLGLDDFHGILKPGQPFAAHPRIERGKNGESDTLINFSVQTSSSSTITIYEIDPQGKLLKQYSHQLPGFAFLHDMAITPNYCIFLQNPVKFHPLPFILGLWGAAECIDFDPKSPTKIILIPRHGGTVKILETEPCFVFHHGNAWEEGDQVFLDSICYQDFNKLDRKKDFRETDFDSFCEGKLWRFQMNLTTEAVSHKIIDQRFCEFPTLHPEKVGQPYRYLYMGAAHNPTGNAPLQAILKVDFLTGKQQLWSEAPRGFINEPIFVPRPDSTEEDDGWLLVLTYNAAYHRSDLIILNAQDLTAQPLARLHLKHHIPHGFHGCFVPEIDEFTL